ncbi:MAG: monovalent cation/H+ antiporter subunit D family protein, partial [Henriciella sp.]
MSGETLILAALILPLLTAAGIMLAGKLPDIREGITLLGAAALFVTSCGLAGTVGAGMPAEFVLGTSVPGLDFAFKLEPLGA